MKKICLIVLCLMLLLSLVGCRGAQPTVIHGTGEATGLTIDTQAGTIQDSNENVYRYNVDNSRITIIFPNGDEVISDCRYSRYSRYSIFSSTASYARTASYASVEALVAIVKQTPEWDWQTNINPAAKFILPAAIQLLIGIPLIKWPEKTWRITEGWKYQNVKPSDKYLIFNKILGFFFVVSGGVLMLIFLSLLLR